MVNVRVLQTLQDCNARFICEVLGSSQPGREDNTLEAVLNHAERIRIREALAEADGKRIQAAASLDIDRTTLYRLMKKHGISDL